MSITSLGTASTFFTFCPACASARLPFCKRAIYKKWKELAASTVLPRLQAQEKLLFLVFAFVARAQPAPCTRLLLTPPCPVPLRATRSAPGAGGWVLTAGALGFPGDGVGSAAIPCAQVIRCKAESLFQSLIGKGLKGSREENEKGCG